MRLTKSRAQQIVSEVGRNWDIPQRLWPTLLWETTDRKLAPGFFHPRTSKQPNVIVLYPKRAASMLAVLLHELSHWIGFEATKMIPAPHDVKFWYRLEWLYREYGVTPAEARKVEVEYPRSWHGIRSWQ